MNFNKETILKVYAAIVASISLIVLSVNTISHVRGILIYKFDLRTTYYPNYLETVTEYKRHLNDQKIKFDDKEVAKEWADKKDFYQKREREREFKNAILDIPAVLLSLIIFLVHLKILRRREE